MKTIILYASKYGATRDIAQRIAGKMNDAITFDLNTTPPSLSQYDCVIIGSPLYAGTINAKVKEYINQNTNVLRTKRLGLFLSGLDESREKDFFQANFSNEILLSAKAKKFLGGVFDPKKTNFFERLIMKMVTKQSIYTTTIQNEKIDQFIVDMSK